MSEVEVTVGRIVMFRYAKSEISAPRELPAIVVQTSSVERCDLCVFTLRGPVVYYAVAHSESPCEHRSWHWPVRV